MAKSSKNLIIESNYLDSSIAITLRIQDLIGKNFTKDIDPRIVYEKLINEKQYFKAIKLCIICLNEEGYRILTSHITSRIFVYKPQLTNFTSKQKYNKNINYWLNSLENIYIMILNDLIKTHKFEEAKNFCSIMLQQEADRINYKIASMDWGKSLQISNQTGETVYTKFAAHLRIKLAEINELEKTI